MITYLNNSNAKQYHILFDKATALLKSKKPDSLTEALRSISENQGATPDELWRDFTISSLNEYFAYLEDILKAAHQDSNEDAERFYVRLPLDEDVFAINADTREVVIPASFDNSGVGVQGDELAEVVYFTIDRFFDSMDLASDNIHIAIQWELTRNGEQVKGFSRNFGKDIESVPGKIIFGWPISHELTETPGSIRFAVRFYSIDADNQSFNYSLTTLPASVKINSSLDHEVIAKSQEEINHGSIITSRIKNAGIYNPSMPTPSAPLVTTPLYVINPASEAKIVDLPVTVDNNSGDITYGSVKIGVGAQPADVGVVGYAWKKFSYIPESGEYDSNSSPITTNINIEYVEVTGELLNKDYQYYTNEGEDVYSLLDVETTLKPYADTNTYPFLYENLVGEEGQEEIENTPEESNSPVGYETLLGNFITHIYKKISTVEVGTTGIYTVDISARALVNTTTTTMKAENGIKIPGPLTPVITMPADKTTIENEEEIAHIIVDNEPVTLTPVVAAGEDGKTAEEVGANPVVAVSSIWQKYDNGEWVEATSIDNKVAVNNDGTLTVIGVNEEATIGDLYRIAVTSTRNIVSTTAYSGSYRVTNSPIQPEVNVRDYNAGSRRFEWTPRNYQTTNNNIKNMGANALLEVGVTAAGLKTDNISYIWVKANRTDAEILYGQYAVDLPDNPNYLNFIQKINSALGITDTSEPTNGEDVNRTKDDAIAELNKIATVTVDAVDNQSRYETSYQPTETGVYYCVVVNELNNNIAVNVSPFFIVS